MSGEEPSAPPAPPGAVRMVAPAKLTVSLRVLGRRTDGFHEIEAEMVTLDLFDVLWLSEGKAGIEVRAGEGSRAVALPTGQDNIVARALRAVGRRAAVRIDKRIPVGGGLGGGSADAAAVLRWAGVADAKLAVSLGADVPFCVQGGRAAVGGIGERVTPLPYEARHFVLLVPPFAVDTAAVYQAWDGLAAGGAPRRRPAALDPEGRNGLCAAALAAEPRLARWGERLAAATGAAPVLAGSGSTWWVEGRAEELGLGGRGLLESEGEAGLLVEARTVPAGWEGRVVGGEPPISEPPISEPPISEPERPGA